MALAIVLIFIVVASVLFHFLSPWTFTELASNWGAMDTMFNVSMAITGLVFVLVSAFVIYAVIRFRAREGHKAEYEPDNKKLEWWLIGLTTVGIVGLLAPGLVVYSDFVRVPEAATKVEVVGQQWQFSYRYPGEDGKLGTAAVHFMGFDNPFGLDPEDPAGADDVLIQGGDLRLPVNRPVRIVTRSKDVLHSVFVPQFRAKMDMVPGMVTSFWFTPTRTGRFEILCTQHCGVGHFNMRGNVLVMEQDEFDNWLAQQDTFADTRARAAGRVEDPRVTRGRQIADSEGCMACHSLDGSRRVGPTWHGLYGSEVTLTDGSTVVADEDYIRRSITEPSAQITQGYPPVMQSYQFDEDQLAALVAYIRAQSVTEEEPEATTVEPSAERGRELAQINGCMACHSVDGARRVGPTWKGLYGSTVKLADGSSVVADADYIKESIRNPGTQLTEGYPAVMQPYAFSAAEMADIVEYIRQQAD